MLTWTNQAAGATVTRSAGLLITWSGGAPGTIVVMTGSSSAIVGGQSVFGSFTCIAPVSAMQLTVPNYVTAVLPAGSGSLTIANDTNYQTFSATGLDYGASVGFVAYQIKSTYR